MDGHSLSQALVKLSGDDLRIIYALLCKTNILNLISTKTKDLISLKETNYFSKHLEEEAGKLNGKTDEELRLDLFLELTKIAKLKGSRYDSPEDIEKKCQKIVDWGFGQFQKKYKEFLSYYHQHEFTKLEAMINWQMNQVFKELDLKLSKLSQEEKNDFAARIMEYVRSLPIEQQGKIMEKLGVQEISTNVIYRVIAQSGASLLFAAIVEASGFAFYTTATSMLASFTGIFGMTLPFGAYTTLTSTIAFLANPLIMLPLILGGSVLIVNQQNKALRKRLVPIVLMQISLPYFTDPVLSHYDLDLMVNEWTPRMKEYEELYDKLNENQQEQKQLQEKIQQLKHEIQTKEMEKRKRENSIANLKGNIKVQLIQDKNRPFFEKLTDDLDMYRKEIVLLERKMAAEKNAAPGLWGTIRVALKSNNHQSEIGRLKRKIDVIYDSMVERVVRGKVAYSLDYVDRIGELYAEVNELFAEIASLKTRLDRLTKELLELEGAERSLKNNLKVKETETYGLEHLLLNREGVQL